MMKIETIEGAYSRVFNAPWVKAIPFLRSMLSARILRERTAYAVLGLLVVALWLPRTQGPIDLRWDGSVYYVLGTSLAEGKGYRLLNEPGEIQANVYPPLFPLIIATHQLALGTNDTLVVGRVLRLSTFLVFSTYIFAVYALLRRHLSMPYAFFGTVICLLNVLTYFMSDVCFPDLLYALFTVGFLLTCSSEERWPTPKWEGIFAITAFALRTAGVALLAAWIGDGLVKRRWKTAVIRFAIAVVPVLGWFSYVHYVETSVEYQRPAYAYQREDYMNYNISYARNVLLKDPYNPELGYATLRDKVERCFHNAAQVPGFIGEAVSSSKWRWERVREVVSKRLGFEAGPRWIVDVPLFALGCLVLLGAGILATQGRMIFSLCLLSSIFVMCLTPWPWQFTRYLMPTVPLLALSLCTAIIWLLEQSQQPALRRWRRFVWVLAWSVIVGIALQQIGETWFMYRWNHLPVQYQTRQGDTLRYRLFSYTDSYRVFDSGLDWVMAHAKPSDVIASSMSHWVYLRTGNKTVMPPFESNPIKAEQLLESVPVTYLILEEGLPMGYHCKRFMKGVVEKFPDRWKRVYGDDFVTDTAKRLEQGFEIYERVHR